MTAQLHQRVPRLWILSWYCASHTRKAEFHHHRRTLRLLGRHPERLSWRCSLQSLGAELHRHQQGLRLLYRWRWNCTLHHHEAHSQVARRSNASSLSRSCRPSPSGYSETPSTPFETTLVCSPARNATVLPCDALRHCSLDGRSNTMASSNSHRTWKANFLVRRGKTEKVQNRLFEKTVAAPGPPKS